MATCSDADPAVALAELRVRLAQCVRPIAAWQPDPELLSITNDALALAARLVEERKELDDNAVETLANTAEVARQHDAQVRAKALEEARNALCSQCAKGEPFPHQEWVEDDTGEGSEGYEFVACPAGAIRALAAGRSS